MFFFTVPNCAYQYLSFDLNILLTVKSLSMLCFGCDAEAGGQGGEEGSQHSGGGHPARRGPRLTTHHAPLRPHVQLPSAVGEPAGGRHHLQPRLHQQEQTDHRILFKKK